jgi:hypothetical protein
MKKTILFIFLITIIISACEKDDFCIQNPVTPNLVLRFYDNTNRETIKTAQRLSVWSDGKDTLAIYTSVNTDSIAIPLNTLSEETIYNLKINNIDGKIANNKIATFTIKYTTQEDYVSRSCGYRILFNNVNLSVDSNSWVIDFTPVTLTTVDNQNAAHVQIFH